MVPGCTRGNKVNKEMTLNEYQTEVMRTARRDKSVEDKLTALFDLPKPDDSEDEIDGEDLARILSIGIEDGGYAIDAEKLLNRLVDKAYARHTLAVHALGLAGEAGEFADLIKKHIGHSQPLDKEKAKKELGDVSWYGAALASDLGFKAEAVAQANVDKLRARYPNGFTPAESVEKKDEPKPTAPMRPSTNKLDHGEPPFPAMIGLGGTHAPSDE